MCDKDHAIVVDDIKLICIFVLHLLCTYISLRDDIVGRIGKEK